MRFALVLSLALLCSLPAKAQPLYFRNRPFTGACNPAGDATTVDLKQFADIFGLSLRESDGGYAVGNTTETPSPGQVLVNGQPVASTPAPTGIQVNLKELANAAGLTYRVNPALGSIDVLAAPAPVSSLDRKWAAYNDPPALNLKVLAYAETQLGNRVGNGECWTLAAQALISAGAMPARGYTFGRKLAQGEAVCPGDIIQFESAHFEGHDGARHWWRQLGSPHHTAVVRKVIRATRYEILEQNPNPVASDTIDFATLKSGSYEIYRPQTR